MHKPDELLIDSRRPRTHSAQQYLRSAEEMKALFDIPQAIDNAIEIGMRCNVQVSLGTYYLPDYPIPDNKTPSNTSKMVLEGLNRRLSVPRERLGRCFRQSQAQASCPEFELNVINQMGFAGYFLIVMEFIAWAKGPCHWCGPGGGLAWWVLVAHAGWTTTSTRWSMTCCSSALLNPERVSMPGLRRRLRMIRTK